MKAEDPFPDTSKTAAFAELDEAERASVLGRGERRRYGPGDVVFREGEPARRVILVTAGGLKLTKVHEEGKEAIVRYIKPGEFTAAIAVFSEKEYPVTAKAVSNTETISWNRPAMLSILNDHPLLALDLLRVAVERLDEVQGRLLELQAERVEQRVARAVLRLMEQSGRKTGEGILIDLRLTRQELADYTGTTLYTVSRILSGWGRLGWIQSGRERIVVIDPHALVEFAEGAS